MTKRFCDYCGDEIEFPVNDGYKSFSETTVLENKPIGIEVRVFVPEDRKALYPDICKTCVYEALDRFDPRPQNRDDS